MKVEAVISVGITKEEKQGLIEKMAETMVASGEPLTFSSFIRQHIILPYLNGSPTEKPTEEPEKANGPNFEDINF